jgi:hypothetical protein
MDGSSTRLNVAGFYQAVGDLLGVPHEATPLDKPGFNRLGEPTATSRAARWDRRPGNGRYPGHGIARVYGDRVHLALRSPLLVGSYASMDQALQALCAALNR